MTVRTTPESLALLRVRFLRRRELAGLLAFPEGYEFEHRLGDDDVGRRVVILTPPNQIAVQNGDGTWTRRLRRSTDPPPPYTLQWYMDYLRSCNLPGWFLSFIHIGEQTDGSEALWLGRPNMPIIRPQAPANYLDIRYPHEPMYPRPDIYGTGQAYAYDITGAEQRSLARRFPATNVALADLRIFVLPSGHIQVRHRSKPQASERLAAPGEVQWRHRKPTDQLASYEVTLPNGPQHKLGGVLARSASVTELEQFARERGGLVNPDQQPRGVGEWEWLEDGVDDYRAAALGFNTPEEVHAARQNGLLAQGMGPNAGPLVVFYPNHDFWNPEEQPEGDGHFEYLTTEGDGSARAHAMLDFAGQDDHGFANNPAPTAQDIWELRQRYQALIAAGHDVDDPTEEHDLVWVPEGANGSPMTSPPPTGERQVGNDVGQLDPHSGLVHDPLNRGENDQTGQSGRGIYQTRLLPADRKGNVFTRDNPKQYTVDRARAHRGIPEDHKGYVLTNEGNWYKWLHFDTIDWDNAGSVEKLNKWREQAANRYGWPRKRDEDRETYTQQQRQWLFDNHVRPQKDSTSRSIGFDKMTDAFNLFFGASRNKSGIQSVYSRLCDEFKKYGKMKEKRKRGENRRRKSGQESVVDEVDEGEGEDDKPAEDGEGDGDGEDGIE